MNRIYLIGFMASGKSTIGKLVAERLGYDFIDLDAYIETSRGTPISQIFSDLGEPAFRQMETEALKTVSEISNVVIATGGGTPCSPDNMTFIKKSGLSIFLNVNSTVILGRLDKERAHRPLVAGFEGEELRDFIRDTLQKRRQFYAQSDLVIQAEGETEQVLSDVLIAVEKFNVSPEEKQPRRKRKRNQDPGTL